MKLISLKIEERFRSLPQNFEIKFQPQIDQTAMSDFRPYCLVGLNGCGKSNVLEALAHIFYHLELCVSVNLPSQIQASDIFSRTGGKIVSYHLKYYWHDSGNSSYDDRGNINQIKIYLKRSGESEILNDGEIMATLVHEMTHTYTDFQGYNNVFSLRYIATKEMYDKTVIPVTPVRQYEEAAAITVEEKFRNEMKLEPRNEKYGIISTKNGSYGFFIHDVMMLPAGEDNPYKGRIDIINDDLDSVKRPTLMMTKLIALDIKRTALKMGFFYNK